MGHIIIIAFLAAAVIVLLIVNFAHAAEIRRISRRLRFIRDNRSNMEIPRNTPFRGINELTDSINGVLKKYKKIEMQNERRESDFKATITNLSHDIRTPLTSLDGYFQLLSQAESDEEKAHYSEIIGERIESLKDILEELFTYTKLQNDDFELSLEPIDIKQILFNSVFAFYDDFTQTGIEPKINICDEALKIFGNEEALKRVFHNIIKNAREHGESGKTAFVSIELSAANDRVLFKCSNSFTEKEDMDVERVFERFYKYDNARTNSSTGLGLSIAKELVQRMGGKIKVEFKENIFTVTAEFSRIK